MLLAGRVAAVGIACLGVGLVAFSALTSRAEAESALVDVLAARVTVGHGGSSLEIAGERVVRGGDRIRTDASGQALITYRDGSTVLLDADSELVIELIQADERGILVRMTQTLGRAWYTLSRTLSGGSRFDVHSPAMASVIRAGSGSYVVVGPDGETTIVATQGSVQTEGGGVSVTVDAGSSTSVSVGSTPSSPAPGSAPVPPPTPAPTATLTPGRSSTPTAAPTATPTAAPSSTRAPTPFGSPTAPSSRAPTASPTNVISVPSASATPQPLPALTVQPTRTIPALPTVPSLAPTLP